MSYIDTALSASKLSLLLREQTFKIMTNRLINCFLTWSTMSVVTFRSVIAPITPMKQRLNSNSRFTPTNNDKINLTRLHGTIKIDVN